MRCFLNTNDGEVLIAVKTEKSLRYAKFKNIAIVCGYDPTMTQCHHLSLVTSVSKNSILNLHNTIIHCFNPPKICIGIVLDFPEDIFMSQEKLQTMIMQNFGGLKRYIMGFVQVEN